MGRLIDTSDLNNQIMLSKNRFGSLSVPICNIFEDMIMDTPTAKAEKSLLEDIKAEIEKDSLSDVNGSKFIFVKRVNEILDKHIKGEYR